MQLFEKLIVSTRLVRVLIVGGLSCDVKVQGDFGLSIYHYRNSHKSLADNELAHAYKNIFGERDRPPSGQLEFPPKVV